MGDTPENFDVVVEDGFVVRPQANMETRLIVQEFGSCIRMKTTMGDPQLSVAEAREVARRIYVLAKRIERKGAR